MYIESKIIDFGNTILSGIQDKTGFLSKKSYLINNIDHIMFIAICISIIASTFVGNGYSALSLCIVSALYILTLIFKKGADFKLNKSLLFLFLYFLTGIISTINSTLVHASIIGFSKTTLYFIYFLGIYQYTRLHKDKTTTIAAIVSCCISAEIVIAFIQNNTNVLSAATWQDTSRLNPEQVLTRVYGTLKPSNPNLLGGYFIASAPLLWLYTSIKYLKKEYKLFIPCLIFSILTIPAIFMTGCRGAYIAIFFMLIILFCSAYKLLKESKNQVYYFINQYKIVFIAAIIGIGTAVMLFVPKISSRIISIFAMRNDSSTSFRMNVYNSSVQMFQDNFLLGIGCGNKVFREIYGLYMLSGFDALSAYSVFLEIAVENGILGLIFYILFLFYLIKDALKKLNKTNNIETKLILIASIISIVGVLIHGFVDTVYFRPQIQIIYWISVAITFTVTEEKENKLS